MTLNRDLTLKATTSLIKYAEKRQESEGSANLLADEEELIHLVLTTRKVSTSARHKPYRIPLRVPLYNEDRSVCMFIKSDDETYVEKLRNLKIPQIKDIVTMNQLKTEYKSYEARRLLMNSHDLFLTDDRLITRLPEVLGVKFFKAKKLPAPVNLKSGNLKNEITRALSCTYYRPTKGTCCAIKIGHTNMAPASLTDNVAAVVDAVVALVPKGWDNVQSFGIKTATSLTLPIYNALPTVASTIGEPTAVVQDASLGDTDKESQQEKKKKETATDAASATKAKKSRKSPLSRTKADAAVKAFAKKRAATKA
ncbi:proteasome-interacting protein cic1 [Coemansia sp. RSA 552]|nr:proteasome-interacting protein cic1 [Coemansia sp. RSA 552]